MQYLNALNQYQALVKQRNLLLKKDKIDSILLDTYDMQMAQNEVIILQERRAFIETINHALEKHFKSISISDMKANVSYKSCLNVTGTLYEDLLNMHKNARERDLILRTTTVGIHREDMVFTLNDEAILTRASQGQKRMMMLAFKLSLMSYIEQKIHKKPILLLDDVLSELDEFRQKAFMKEIERCDQCIVTATDIPAFLKNKEMHILYIEQGSIVKNRR